MMDKANLHHKARGGRGHPRSIGQALDWLNARYCGQSRRAIKWQMEATSHDITIALQLWQAYRSLATGSYVD